MEKTTLADKYLTFSEESKNLLDPEVVELLIDKFNKIYPAICDFFNDGELRNVIFEADPNFNSPPALIIVIETIDDDNGLVLETRIENNKIKFNPHDIAFQQQQQQRWNVDFITHELVHVAQDYKYFDGSYPSWIVEGLADYGTEKFGLYDKESGWGIIKNLGNHKSYKTGYTIAAGFFIWIEENIDATFSKELNDTLKSCKYNDNYFIEKTGKTVDELWQIYMDENRVYAINWLEKYIDAPLPKDMYDKLKAGDLADELDSYILEKTGRVIDDLWEIWKYTTK